MRHSPLAQSALPLLFAIGLAFVLRHFVGSLAWAGLLAVITWPLHERLLRRGWPRPLSAAFLVALLVAAFALMYFGPKSSPTPEPATAPAPASATAPTAAPGAPATTPA